MILNLHELNDGGTLFPRIKNESGDVPDSFCLQTFIRVLTVVPTSRFPAVLRTLQSLYG